MGFWLAIAAIGAAVTFLLLRAAQLGGAKAQDSAKYDIVVYKDQLGEIDRDLARGVLASGEAEAARAEVGRRLLSANRTDAPLIKTVSNRSLLVPLGAGVVAVAGAFLTYSMIGALGYRDLSLETRKAMARDFADSRPTQAQAAASDPEVETTSQHGALVSELRVVLKDRPDDLEGHRLLARNEAGLGRFQAASAAQERVLALLGDQATPADHMMLAQHRLGATGGSVTPEVEDALRAALTLDETYPPARYGMGLLFQQTGRPDLAFRAWNPLLQEGPEVAPWIAPIRRSIDDIAARAGVPRYTQPGASGPSAQQIEDAQDMAPEDRAAFIESMVESLSERLGNRGGTAQEWAQLIRALGVLGRTDQAGEVFGEAERLFTADQNMNLIEAAAREAGVLE